MKIKRVLQIWIWLLFFMGNTLKVQAEEGKLIYFVYDNSGSMVEVGKGEENPEAPVGTPRSWGAQAQYAVKAFCTMSNPEDEIRLYPIDKKYVEGTWPKTITNIEGKDNYQEEYTKLIDEIDFNGQNTLYTEIENAIKDIKIKNFSGEKWVVIFTDGILQNYKKADEFYEKLTSDLAGTDINFYFVGLNPRENSYSSLKSGQNIKFYHLSNEKNGTILQSILKVTEEIYGKRRFPKEMVKESTQKDKKILSMEFGIPVSDVMVILQAEGDSETGEKISFDQYLSGSKKYEITSLSKSKKEKSMVHMA